MCVLIQEKDFSDPELMGIIHQRKKMKIMITLEKAIESRRTFFENQPPHVLSKTEILLGWPQMPDMPCEGQIICEGVEDIYDGSNEDYVRKEIASLRHTDPKQFDSALEMLEVRLIPEHDFIRKSKNT